MDVFEWIFIISGFVFFVSMICALILMAIDKWKTVVIFGVVLAVLMVPIVIALINFIIVGKSLNFTVYLILIFAYLLTEFLLDRVFKIDFRSKLSQHIPYIILEWAACFSFLFGAITIDTTIGWIMAIFFWIFVGVLINYFIIQAKKKKKNG
ncbi:MAG: hypothetical protein ACFE9R_01335 [Candidatus Hermodarchaeota archaeon]